MTTFLIIALVVSLVVAAATALANWIGDDGGPRPTPPPRIEDSWSFDLPSHPYATS